MMLNRYAFLVLSLSLMIEPLSAGWLSRKCEGWAWYEQKVNKESEERIEEEANIENIRHDLEAKLAEAVIHPNEENVLAFMSEQKKWIEKSGRFAQLWAKLLLLHPELDLTATTTPTSQYGIQVQKAALQEGKEEMIRGLKKDHGLMFFYEGNSPISQAFAFVVHQFIEKYGWNAIAVSVDHQPLPGFSENREDNGISQTFGVEVFPALYIVDPANQEVTPISFGMVSLEQIETNVFHQFEVEEGAI